MLRRLSVGVALVVVIGCGSRNAATTSVEASQDALRAWAAPTFHEVTIVAGTVLPLTLETTVASNLNHVEDRVQARLSQPIVIDGVVVVPQGSRVDGRARIAIRFDALVVNGARYDIATNSLRGSRRAPKRDAARLSVRLTRPLTIRLPVDVS